MRRRWFPRRRHSRSVADIEHERSVEWVEVPQPSENVLRNRMVQMYWVGVSREVVFLIRALRSWQEEQYAEVRGEDEVLQTEDMRGFKAFVERAVGRARGTREQAAIRETIREMQRNARVLSEDQRRAQILLQGAGFLDISKLMEYRKPMEDIGLWARPRAAQLALSRYDLANHMPTFRPLVCAQCSTVIRGTHFRCLHGCPQPNQNPPSNEPLELCETCMRNGSYHRGTHLQKREKRCILREVVTPTRSRQICTCENGQPDWNGDGDSDGRDGDLHFAVDGGYPHQRSCPVLKLKWRHERAKLEELRHSKTQDAHLSAQRGERVGSTAGARTNRGHQGKKRGGGSAQVQKGAVDRAARILPPPIEFGNVHMMLVAGTIIIENGVPDSNGGARISIRDPPQFTMLASNKEGADHQMSISPDRRIFQRNKREEKRRIKACMKQVVGGIFTGLYDGDMSEREWDVINALVEGSRRCAYDPLKTEAYHDARIREAAQLIVDRLRVLIGDSVTRYFSVIASKLFTVELPHNYTSNHCQRFCAKILDFRAFGSFLATTPACRIHVPTNPHYLVSFVCAPGSYDTPRPIRPKTKTQAPNGLTEEYLLRFRQHGHHEESDIADTLMEYWQDWGAFGGPLYKYQGLFPWDCTEAYRKGEPESDGKCNNCSLVKHVWSFPFDAWSMVQLHIHRNRSFYSPHHSGDKTLSDPEWMRNRLNVLSALRALNTVAVAMAKTLSFRASCRWNRERNALTPDTASALDRLKLSGIHRAQPHSHFFEQSKYHDCTLADWALLSRKDQIMEYEELRDHRADELAEIPPRQTRRRTRSRFPRTENQPNRTEISPTPRHRHEHHHEQNRDSETEDSPVTDDEDIEEAGFEYGGGLLPDTFGPDPGDDEPVYDELDYDAEAGSGLLPASFGADPDTHYHAPGAGSCDYNNNDDEWRDIIPDRTFEDCRSIGASDSCGDYRQPPFSTSEGYERNERASSLPNTSESATDRRLQRLLESVADEIPSIFDPANINPDTSIRYDTLDRYNYDNDILGSRSLNDYDVGGSSTRVWEMLSDMINVDNSSNNNNNNYDYTSSFWSSFGNNNNNDWWGGSGGGGWFSSGNNNNDWWGGSGGDTYYSSGNNNNDWWGGSGGDTGYYSSGNNNNSYNDPCIVM